MTAAAGYYIAPAQQIYVDGGKDDYEEMQDTVNQPLLVGMTRQSVDLVRSGVYAGKLPYQGFDGRNSDPLAVGPPNIGAIDQEYFPRRGVTSKPYVIDAWIFTLIGNSNADVSIADVSVRVVDRRPPPGGTLLLRVPEGGAVVEQLGFNLEWTDKSALAMDADTGEVKHFFENRQISVKKDEVVTLKASVFARDCQCDFVLDVITGDGRVVQVDDRGRPFTITSFASHYKEVHEIVVSFDGLGGVYDGESDFNVVPCEWLRNC